MVGGDLRESCLKPRGESVSKVGMLDGVLWYFLGFAHFSLFSFLLDSQMVDPLQVC